MDNSAVRLGPKYDTWIGNYSVASSSTVTERTLKLLDWFQVKCQISELVSSCRIIPLEWKGDRFLSKSDSGIRVCSCVGGVLWGHLVANDVLSRRAQLNCRWWRRVGVARRQQSFLVFLLLSGLGFLFPTLGVGYDGAKQLLGWSWLWPDKLLHQLASNTKGGKERTLTSAPSPTRFVVMEVNFLDSQSCVFKEYLI